MAFERKCYRKILRIGWTQKVTNTDLYGRIQLKENILQKLIGRKLGLFGHICRMHNNRKIKELMFGRIEDTNKREKPHREWQDEIIRGGRDVASETESDGVGQRKLEEVDETGIGYLRALSPWLLMVMMMNPGHHTHVQTLLRL